MTMQLVDQSIPGQYRYACSECGAGVVVPSIGTDIPHRCEPRPVVDEIVTESPAPKRRRKGTA